MSRKEAKCPRCGSIRNWLDGTKKGPHGKIQRYLCRDCRYRFSEK